MLLALSASAELLVAWVIYYEWEGGRLDEFLADADRLVQDRNNIYLAYCGLEISEEVTRESAFKKLLDSSDNKELLDSCHKNIRLLSRIGARLPKVWWLKRTPLDWHVAAILWFILGSYVEERRREFGPSYAEWFLRYALSSTNRLLSQKRNSWTLRDPDRSRRSDVSISRQELVKMKDNLKSSLKLDH
jgi:hypothetical protein